MEKDQVLAKGRRCIQIEIEALQSTLDQLSNPFVQVVDAVFAALENGKKLIFSGIGKNAHIANKLVGTFNSIGAPSAFLDPVNALHGDMGLCQNGDLLFAMSNGGETEELLRFVSMSKRFDIQSIAVTSIEDSSLHRLCDLSLPYRVPQEACPLDLAPTASTAATLAIGDALAMVILERKSLSKEDFAKYHPAGSIGRSLSPSVDQIMRTGDRFPLAKQNATCRDCLQEMTSKKSGCIALVDETGSLQGVFSDGDIRRAVLEQPNFLESPVSEIMTRNPITISSGSLAGEALKILEQHSIDDLIIVDSQNHPIGIIDGQDLPKTQLV